MFLRGYILLVLTVLASGTAHAQSDAVIPVEQEHELRAAITLNLARFVNWPSTRLETNADFTICVAPDHAGRFAVKALEGQTIHQKQVQVRFAELQENALENCQIVYFDDHMHDKKLLQALSDKDVLTIGVHDDFFDQGGFMILSRAGRRVQFSINKTAMDMSALTPSSKILTLAADVK